MYINFDIYDLIASLGIGWKYQRGNQKRNSKKDRQYNDPWPNENSQKDKQRSTNYTP
jgi:hypothetical protein